MIGSKGQQNWIDGPQHERGWLENSWVQITLPAGEAVNPTAVSLRHGQDGASKTMTDWKLSGLPAGAADETDSQPVGSAVARRRRVQLAVR